MTCDALTCSEVQLAVGRRILCRGVDIVIPPGGIHALTGPSGVGKSTLLWVVMGLLRPAAGTVHIAGHPIDARWARRAAAIRRSHLGVVYQQANLITDLSSVENVAVPLMMTRGVPRRTAEDQAAALLRRLGIDTGTPVPYLSGGEQQRVAVARAVIVRPSLVLADEPTASLDEDSAQEVMEILVGLCREGSTALLMATHDSRAAAHADTWWRMSAEGCARQLPV